MLTSSDWCCTIISTTDESYIDWNFDFTIFFSCFIPPHWYGSLSQVMPLPLITYFINYNSSLRMCIIDIIVHDYNKCLPRTLNKENGMWCDFNANPYCNLSICALLYSGERQNCNPFLISASLQQAKLQNYV